jgi:hypothetical protein
MLKYYESKAFDAIKKNGNELLVSFSDLTLEEIMLTINKNDLFKDIPIVKWLYLANNIRSNIQLASFIKKYSNFIGPINKSIPSDYFESDIIDKLLSKNDFEKFIELSIICIDRYQTETKAKLLSILFIKTFKEKIFTIDEYNILMFSIELMHPYVGIKCLTEFYIYYEHYNNGNQFTMEGRNLDFSPLASTCLLNLPKGGAFAGDIGGAFINELGIKFYENVVKDL